jgi:hypothetical protein
MPLASIKEVGGYQLGDAALRDVRPDGLELSAIGQGLAHLDGSVGRRVRAFGNQFAVLQPNDHLPPDDTALLQPLGSVMRDDTVTL